MKTKIHCPECKHVQEIEVPNDRCLPFYLCENCERLIKVPKNFYCVVCAYGEQPCPVSKPR